ncbi:hypothetical protein RHGRI_012981 [Rhododendron griersonianum]|uniref:RING-type E3 ubiquitin transferase n=1 Tax=Rhododendron griersonianum TaxID=479676 RepID=A0AAV6K3Y0_9ERIC|nr:hypothetical protein RHGRI_012981 [Rhododendron griersonianum]KAG5547142.1 hypothetical protein RHGRI_012981 [Rhododendron griersonianum]
MELSIVNVDSDCTLLRPPLTVAVAVKGNGGRVGNGSRRAVWWAAKNLMPYADRFILIHVMPRITSIPTPSRDAIPIERLDAHAVEVSMQDRKLVCQEIFAPFKILFNRKKVETLVLEGDNPASALLKYVTDSGVSSLVLGSCESSLIMRILPSFMVRKQKDPTVPSVVLKNIPETCNIYIVSRRRLITTSANPWSTGENSARNWWCSRGGNGSLRCYKLCGSHYSSPVDHEVADTASSMSDVSHLYSLTVAGPMYPDNSGSLPESNHRNSGNRIVPIGAVNECSFVASANTKQSNVHAEVEKLRLELMNAVRMYKQASEDLVVIQNKVRILSLECLKEAKQVNDALRREEIYRKIAKEEQTKHLEALKEIERARNSLAKEACEKKRAERTAAQESLEKKKIMDALWSNDRRYRRYTRDEIEIATDSLSKTKMIGEGSYGKVYRCDLDKTPVAVKVLHSDASEKKNEFMTEIQVLSQLHHPHIVLLLGACPETGSLVYEYMENGSLEDFLSDQSSRDPLPWFVRFRIAFEVACGLAFLHNSIPDPIIHRDLKPGNIFLDRNYVSKIGDVGLAKLVSYVPPEDITEYRASIVAGTLCYMDPEYQRTGTVRPKSDLYAFGIILLRLLAAQPPNGLLLKFKNAISDGSLPDILDKSIQDWPLVEAQEMAQMALKCSELRCRDRPDLETEVLPLLKRLADKADATLRLRRNSIHPPNHYFCPILQEVMEDPYIAADGFTYEHRAIKAWLRGHSYSPVTRLRLPHIYVIQNHTLRSAIQDWRSRITSSSG